MRVSCIPRHHTHASVFAPHRYISNFKQEVLNGMSLTVSKEIEEAMKELYRKYVKNENTSAQGKRSVSPWMLMP
jgi:hypothetical protein